MRGMDAVKLAGTSARLGEAALDPMMWPQIMDDICRGAGALGAALLQSDVRTPDVPRTASADELFKNYFEQHWHTRDVRAEKGMPLMRVGARVVTDQMFLSADEMRLSVFYNEAIMPFGFRWFAGVLLKAGDAPWVLTLQRTASEGPFEVGEARLLATLSDRLTEVATLSTAVGRVAITSATNALNLVRLPAVAIDRSGFVLDANPSAEALFGPELYIKDGRLEALPSTKSQLEKLFEALRRTPDTYPIPPRDAIVVQRKESAPLVLRLLPVPGAARSPFLGARALITFTAVEPSAGPNPILLARTFGLTPAEARLAAMIAAGRNLERAAKELGISIVTVRNQLQAIFAKTDTHRQGELIALLSRIS
jgi:DNA-binding CsgD family transcriptional regulator